MFSIKPIVQDHWDWRAAGNFIFGGTGSGLIFLTACAMALSGADPRWTLLAGVAFVGAGLFLVWLEIGKPWRFLNVFRNPWTSWMSREAYAAAVLYAATLAAAWWATPGLVWLAAVLALVFLFCQAKILHASRGIPAWRDTAVLPVIFLTGLAEGAGALTLAALTLAAMALGLGLPGWLLVTLALALVLRAAAWAFYRARMLDGRAPRAVVTRIGRINATVWILAVAAPLVCVLAALAVPAIAAPAAALGGLLAILSGWHLKFNIVRKLAHMQGLAVRHMPVRGTGTAGGTVRPGWAPER